MTRRMVFVASLALVTISKAGATMHDETRSVHTKTINAWGYLGLVAGEIFTLAAAIIIIMLAYVLSYRIAFGNWTWRRETPAETELSARGRQAEECV
ncbi:hypothetical protein UA08_05864 [Talaromyces atroroseus]|uniref:Uncharacterized protein n=1 Tax=Talaromyces atroroseus TaxID=1441469 RepID=A0A225AND3_TALAT|nr:hypothetical protein UA08_05864 [Talaromyces atroroseus]OKL58798.1 hypothetical protein UA08_05864 [Talaromyces atroroseus]